MKYLLSLVLILFPTVVLAETGMASYYSGVGNKHKFTAAHKTLKFGTKVNVVNKKNGKSVIVIINDRGPFISGRIIDLNYSAAESIGMIRAGVVPVEIEIVK